jgi:branched-subunit amino acid transport protein
MLEFLLVFLYTAPLWTPIVFAAYAAGRKQWGTRFLFALVAAEALSLVASTIASIILGVRTAQLGGP